MGFWGQPLRQHRAAKDGPSSSSSRANKGSLTKQSVIDYRRSVPAGDEIAWKAQLRLAHRYRRLSARGLQHNKVCVAIARELAGFIWSIGQQVSIGT